MNFKNGKCLHVVLYGTFAENKYFLGDYKNNFDIIGFNANLIAHAPDGISAFISKLKNKAFFIDPQTHAFQQPVETVLRKKDGKPVLKNSIQKLSEEYGTFIEKSAGKKPIQAGEIKKGDKETICKNILDFAYNKIQISVEHLEEWEFLSEEGLELRPEFLIAPYFYLEPDNIQNELVENKDFILLSKEYSNLFDDLPIFAEIVLHKHVLIDPEKRNSIIKMYKECKADGFIIWIDDFSEVNVDKDILLKYKDFIKELTSCNKPIISLHGSYFSIILSGQAFKLLAGVGHGIEYGEYRPVIPVGGGVPLSKFYFPSFHKRVNYYPDAQNILLEMDWIKNKDEYYENVCSCRTCKNIIKSNNLINDFGEYGETKISKNNGRAYPSPNAMDKSRRHYLNIKINEYKYCKNISNTKIIQNLESSYKLAEKIKSHSFIHLSKWLDIFKNYI